MARYTVEFIRMHVIPGLYHIHRRTLAPVFVHRVERAHSFPDASPGHLFVQLRMKPRRRFLYELR